MEITRGEVMAAQEQWAKGIVKIGNAFTKKENYEAAAREHVSTLYAYEQGTVLFKPTKATKKQFRGTFDEALSYFVATNGVCSEDSGFALKPWTAVRFENTGLILNGATALAMGNYFFTDTKGEETKAEYTFGYLKDPNSKVRIQLHHSSLPFTN